MNLRENNYENIQTYKLSSISGAKWYVNVKGWDDNYVSVTSSLKAVGKDIYLVGTSSVDVEVVGSSGTLSEQTFKYCAPASNKVVYAFLRDMYVGNSKKLP